MKETLQSSQVEKRDEVLQELKEKHVFYSDLIKRNRLDTPHIHKQYCQSDSHRQCGANWGHASILQEIIARIWWWFTGEKPIFINVSTKPKLKALIEAIDRQRAKEYWQENEIEDDEYLWLMMVLDSCKSLLGEKPLKKSRRRISNDSGNSSIQEPTNTLIETNNEMQ